MSSPRWSASVVRSPRPFTPRRTVREKTVTVWCSNDYLGMGQNPAVLDAMKNAVDKYGAGAGGTRNISGRTNCTWIWKLRWRICMETIVLLFSSGYVANEGALDTDIKLFDNPVVFSDQLNHASIIHGIRSAKAECKVFRHNDVEHLEQLLSSVDVRRPKIIAFESVYSMEGTSPHRIRSATWLSNTTPLPIWMRCTPLGCTGIMAAGLRAHADFSNRIDMVEGTFGKAYGLMGGFITGRRETVDAVRSFASGFIFTTSLPPAVLAGVLASVEYLKTSTIERTRAHANAALLKQSLDAQGFSYLKGESHIVPLMIGDARCCKMLTDILLQDHDIYVQPINYPTVPRGTERMRLTATAAHTADDIRHFVNVLSFLYEQHHLPMQMRA